LRGGVGFAGMRMGRATDKGDEFPPPHRAYPKAKDDDLIIQYRASQQEVVTYVRRYGSRLTKANLPINSSDALAKRPVPKIATRAHLLPG
jgi:hypothetical protein